MGNGMIGTQKWVSCLLPVHNLILSMTFNLKHDEFHSFVTIYVSMASRRIISQFLIADAPQFYSEHSWS